jgi:hypothetical protein
MANSLVLEGHFLGASGQVAGSADAQHLRQGMAGQKATKKLLVGQVATKDMQLCQLCQLCVSYIAAICEIWNM